MMVTAGFGLSTPFVRSVFSDTSFFASSITWNAVCDWRHGLFGFLYCCFFRSFLHFCSRPLPVSLSLFNYYWCKGIDDREANPLISINHAMGTKIYYSFDISLPQSHHKVRLGDGRDDGGGPRPGPGPGWRGKKRGCHTIEMVEWNVLGVAMVGRLCPISNCVGHRKRAT